MRIDFSSDQLFEMVKTYLESHRLIDRYHSGEHTFKCKVARDASNFPTYTTVSNSWFFGKKLRLSFSQLADAAVAYIYLKNLAPPGTRVLEAAFHPKQGSAFRMTELSTRLQDLRGEIPTTTIEAVRETPVEENEAEDEAEDEKRPGFYDHLNDDMGDR